MTYPVDDQLTTEDSQPRTTDDLRTFPSYLGGSIPSQGSPPTAESIPADVRFDRPTAPAGLASPFPATPAPRRRGGARPVLMAMLALAALIGVIVAVALVRPVPAPAAPPVGTMSQPSPADPSVGAATARAQLSAAYGRLGQAAQQFDQAAQAADKSGDEQASLTAVRNVRAAVYAYDQEVRGIAFPTQEQTLVNTQLLPATDRMITDLDQADDPATVLQVKSRATQDGKAADDATQEVYDQLGN